MRNKSVYIKNNLKLTSEVCGIFNIGNNCYLNSGLQILASCDKLKDELDRNNNTCGKNILTLLKDAFNTLLYKKIYDPSDFIKYFSKINIDFVVGTQCCSQNFIRTLIRNINEESINNRFDLIYGNEQYPKTKTKEYKEYEKFVKNIYPESRAQSIFSGITKSHSYGKCPYCNEKIDNYSFNFFLDQIMYLDDFDGQCKFSEVLKANLGNDSNLSMGCPKCEAEIEVKEETRIIKLPEILIFTLERYQGTPNKVKIEPDFELKMNDYIDKSLLVESTLYELFAINIRLGSTINFGHEICQVKRIGKWYEINDSRGDKITKPSHFDSSYGLFYQRKASLINGKKIIINISNQNENKTKETEQNLGDNETKLRKEIITQNRKMNDNTKITPNIQIINNIDNNITFGIETIDICKEVIINNIKNEDILNPFKNYLNEKYSHLKASEYSQYIISKLLEELKNFKSSNNKGKNYRNYKSVNAQPDAYSIFSLSTSFDFNYYCKNCRKFIKNYKVCNSTEIFINLPQQNSLDFKDILDINFSNHFWETDKCSMGHQIKKYLSIRFIKLPEILIFTLNRKKGYKINKIKIKPNDTLDINKYIDSKYIYPGRTSYQLFALNLLKKDNSGYECQIKIDDVWYQISNNKKYILDKPSCSEYIYGLFYKRI